MGENQTDITERKSAAAMPLAFATKYGVMSI